MRRVRGARDLQREATCQTLGGALDRILTFVGRQSLFALHAEVQGAVAAAATAAAAATHGLLWGDSAVDADLAGTDAGFGVGKDVALGVY